MKKLDVIKFIIVFAMVCGFVYQTNAQSPDRKWAVGAYANIFEYKGDFGNDFFSFDFDKVEVGGGLSLAKYLNPSFDLTGRFSACEVRGVYTGTDDVYLIGGRFHTTIISSNLNLVYKFNNGYLLPEDFIIQPFITAGIGGIYAAAEGKNSRVEYNAKKKIVTPGDLYAGLGFRIRIGKAFGVAIQTGFHQPLSDRIDGERTNANFDKLWEHSIGVYYNIADPKDSDKDGIPDNRDHCKDTPEGASVDKQGCPIDSDKDGIADFQDSCPDIPGIIRFNGCPDTDGDGIMDKEDDCPDQAGLKRFKGCPDRDKDAIGDREDECPDDPGPLEMKGCPCDYKAIEKCGDDDNDGISNAKDKCPDTPKGATVNQDGCPKDSDGDGVYDGIDKCAGTAKGVKVDATGCPQEDLTSTSNLMNAENILFETAKDVLRPESKVILDRLAKLMLDYPKYNLKISGYTDDQGSNEYNLDLSKKRAASPRDYLISKGVPVARITSDGYGETNFVDTNSTPEGRQKNRRTEFKLFLP